MKRLILITLMVMVFSGIALSHIYAEDEPITVTVTASSEYSSSFTAQRTIDGDYSTYWIGIRNAPPWWIQFDCGSVTQIGHVLVTWYSAYYSPQNYDIQVSDDGATWENVYTGLAGIYSASGTIREIGRDARYVRFYVHQATYFPVLREIIVYGGNNQVSVVRFQGVLKDAAGMPLNGNYDIKFKLYDKEAEGAELWEEIHQALTIEEGMLDVELGSISVLNVPFDKQYWLGIEIGSDGEMSPRFKLTTVPYAIRVAN